ncbi:phosphodiester glycosidase family protein [uncultured Psychrobacter sp.]|uniref:phosphodiester glycosidase family protein n=1 Tax=uncultured Psychrobacter sp. TaxID=259303 RepID=UPI0034591942
MPRLIFTTPVWFNPIHLVALALITLTINACQPNPLNNSSMDWSCQTHDKPFSYSVCGIDKQVLGGDDSQYQLQLFWQQPNYNQPLLTFDNLLNTLPNSQTLTFAMNAGMYNEDYAPIGYTVIAGEERRALNLNEGGGNFHLLPNGVMWWDHSGNVQITESHALDGQLKRDQAKPWYATQSGPMLVIDGTIHSEFNPESTSLKFRNGAGVCNDGSVQFVNSEEPVSFYQFAALFKEDLDCDNALFLDGGIASALYAPSINKYDKKEMGVMIGVVQSKE